MLEFLIIQLKYLDLIDKKIKTDLEVTILLTAHYAGHVMPREVANHIIIEVINCGVYGVKYC